MKRFGTRFAMCGAALVMGLMTLPANGMGPQSRIAFAVDREGSPLGTHSTTITRNGDEIEVTVKIDFRVDLAFLTLYRYEHESREVWRNGQLFSLNSKTNDNGEDFAVSALRRGDILVVEGQDGRLEIPGDTLPTSYWNPAFITQERVLDSQRGTLIDINVEPLGRELITSSGETIEACRYRLSGDLRFDIWYDGDGRWVALTFNAKGAEVLYTLDAAPIDPVFLRSAVGVDSASTPAVGAGPCR